PETFMVPTHGIKAEGGFYEPWELPPGFGVRQSSSLPAFAARHSAASARRRLALWRWRRANQKRQRTGAVQDATAQSTGSWSQCMRKKPERGLSMNRPFEVPALAGPDRLKAGLQTSGVPLSGSGSQHMRKTKAGSKNEMLRL